MQTQMVLGSDGLCKPVMFCHYSASMLDTAAVDHFGGQTGEGYNWCGWNKTTDLCCDAHFRSLSTKCMCFCFFVYCI